MNIRYGFTALAFALIAIPAHADGWGRPVVQIVVPGYYPAPVMAPVYMRPWYPPAPWQVAWRQQHDWHEHEWRDREWREHQGWHNENGWQR